MTHLNLVRIDLGHVADKDAAAAPEDLHASSVRCNQAPRNARSRSRISSPTRPPPGDALLGEKHIANRYHLRRGRDRQPRARTSRALDALLATSLLEMHEAALLLCAVPSYWMRLQR